MSDSNITSIIFKLYYNITNYNNIFLLLLPTDADDEKEEILEMRRPAG